MRKSIRVLLVVLVAVSMLSLSVTATAETASAAECMSDGTISPDCGGDDDDDDGGGGGGGGGGCLCPMETEQVEQFTSPAPQLL